MIPQEHIPHILKYMGGKREMLDAIGEAVRRIDDGTLRTFCDLFSGTAIVSYAFSDSYDIVSNDIQKYSSIFAQTYASDFSVYGDPDRVVEAIMEECHAVLERKVQQNQDLSFPYREGMSFAEMDQMEKEQAALVDRAFQSGFSLFQKCYSGTYWSFEQCLWIDSIRVVAESHANERLYYAIMAALVFAMSYCSQSTGHFAQFRTLTPDNYRSILMYRLREIPDYFKKKLYELLATLNHQPIHQIRASSLDYVDCIATLPPHTIIYADPPYSAVHYSRFYHTLETLVLYDNPKLDYRGRYRGDRFQSPFDQKRNVAHAFEALFNAVKKQSCHLLLSYSDNAMLSEDQIDEIATRCLGEEYEKDRSYRDYQHMTMGRNDVGSMQVQELLLSYTKQV